MNKIIAKTIIYTLSLCAGIFIIVQIGNEVFIQVAMLIEGVQDRHSLPEESALVHVGIYLFIPEVIFGAIGGWYFGEWLSGKIYDYEV